MAPFPARRADDPEPLEPDTTSYSPVQPEIEELASRLAEQGIRSTELILDLILHDLAEEARQAVDATGAAIALERGGELVCRAAAGATAPDLGVRIQRESGLSGLCVGLGSTQLCSDTETDSRVDSEACRRLGVRSIVVVPLVSSGRTIGILEAFSPRRNAFSTDDVHKLESLATAAGRTIKTTREKVAPDPASAEPLSTEAEPHDSPLVSVASVMQQASPVDPAVKVLRYLLIGLAIPLIVLIGFDVGWRRAHGPVRPSNSGSQEEPTAPEVEATGPPAIEPGVPVSRPKSNPSSKPKSSVDTANGGLVVYQNGKVVYREDAAPGGKHATPQPKATAGGHDHSAGSAQPEAKSADQSKKSDQETLDSVPTGVTGGRVLQSVSPKYPAEAIARRLEGPVILHGTVGQDGVIRDLKVSSGDPILSEAAVEAVRQWKYDPYRRNGDPISMPIDITIDFNLPK